MKVKVVESQFTEGQYNVEIKQGNQTFKLNYSDSKQGCQWYAKMFRIALKAHDLEQASKDK